MVSFQPNENSEDYGIYSVNSKSCERVSQAIRKQDPETDVTGSKEQCCVGCKDLR